jgi:hypothetical protein
MQPTCRLKQMREVTSSSNYASVITLSGTGSTDADGTISSYAWTQASGPNTAVFSNAAAATTDFTGFIAAPMW